MPHGCLIRLDDPPPSYNAAVSDTQAQLPRATEVQSSTQMTINVKPEQRSATPTSTTSSNRSSQHEYEVSLTNPISILVLHIGHRLCRSYKFILVLSYSNTKLPMTSRRGILMRYL